MSAAFAQRFSIEATRPNAGEITALAELLPAGTPVYFSAVPTITPQDLVAAAANLRKSGLEPVVHIAARRFRAADDLIGLLASLRGEADVRRLLVIGGDIEVSGPFPDALAVIQKGRLREAGIQEIGIGAYPEGHRRIPAGRLEAALDEKIAAAAAQGPHGMPLFVARTGYTGEDGFEIVVPAEHAVALWEALAAAGVAPAGLGARDTLRLEAGMNLYGQDMDETVTPWEANLAWTIALDEGRDFIGRAALEQQKAAGVPRVMVGLVLDDKGVLRHGQKVLTANGEGEILSGSFAPTLNKAVAFARIPAGAPGDVRVDIRGREVPVRLVKYPFVRDGKPCEGI